MLLLQLLFLQTLLLTANAIIEGVDVEIVVTIGSTTFPVRKGEFCFTVYLKLTAKSTIDHATWEAGCGGVLLKRNIVLTAAHCLLPKDAILSKIEAVAGIKDLFWEKESAQKILAKSYVVHEEYAEHVPGPGARMAHHHHDIGLVWLQKKFKLSNRIQLATLPESDVNTDEISGWVVGWGITITGEHSDALKKAKLRAISKDTCEGFLTKTLITDNIFCAIDDIRKSTTCMGDSGGPFVHNGVVLGISSYSYLKEIKISPKKYIVCEPLRPAVFTNIYKYKGWIEENLENPKPVMLPCHLNLGMCTLL